VVGLVDHEPDAPDGDRFFHLLVVVSSSIQIFPRILAIRAAEIAVLRDIEDDMADHVIENQAQFIFGKWKADLGRSVVGKKGPSLVESLDFIDGPAEGGVGERFFLLLAAPLCGNDGPAAARFEAHLIDKGEKTLVHPHDVVGVDVVKIIFVVVFEFEGKWFAHGRPR